MSKGRTSYPLEALESVRRRSLDSALGEFSAAITEAERARSCAEGAVGALGEAVWRRRTEEAAGGDSVMDLGARSRWLARLRAGERLLSDEVERRLEAAARASADVELRRERLLDAERLLRAVARHREKWELARRRAALAAEEAEEEDRALAAQRRT